MSYRGLLIPSIVISVQLIRLTKRPKVVRLLLDYGANPSKQDNDGMTPLHKAAKQVQPSHFNLVVELGN